MTLAALSGAVGLLLAAIGVDLLGAWLAGSIGTMGERGITFVDSSCAPNVTR